MPVTSPITFMTSDFACALAALVDDRQLTVQTLGERTGTHNAADVGETTMTFLRS